VVALVNQQRKTAGCHPLAENGKLDRAAQGHSDDMSLRHYFDHTTPDGLDFVHRILAAGYPRPAAENIAAGTNTAQATVQMWMNSPPHRANILNCELTTIGVGVATNGWYWTQDFGR
jgi:uncharacterized protein YkwD